MTVWWAQRKIANMTGKAAIDGLDRGVLLEALIALAEAAGDIVWRHFVEGATVTIKPDESPSPRCRSRRRGGDPAGLAEVAPHIPIVAEEEEAPPPGVPDVGGVFFPLSTRLDGTKEFIRRGNDSHGQYRADRTGRADDGVV